jgi:hypothetical protein
MTKRQRADAVDEMLNCRWICLDIGNSGSHEFPTKYIWICPSRERAAQLKRLHERQRSTRTTLSHPLLVDVATLQKLYGMNLFNRSHYGLGKDYEDLYYVRLKR